MNLRNLSRTLATLAATCCWAVPAPAQEAAAATDALACTDPALAPAFREVPERDTAPLEMDAATLDARSGAVGIARGNVELRRADQALATEEIRYHPDTRRAVVPGPLRYTDTNLELDAASADYDFVAGRGRFTDVAFTLTGSSANGSAAEARMEGPSRSVLRAIRYTTCPGPRPDWELSAKELELEHDEGFGTARGAKLEFKGVPLLYVPWITFPIDDRRKTGFLYPVIGKASDTGYEAGIPFYWNIAPNQDATITPRWFSDRGTMLETEYRYLTRRQGGQIEANWLPSDDIADRSRHHYTLRHAAAINTRWNGNVYIERVSDDEYFQDFGSSLASTSRQYLHSRASVGGAGRYWTFSALADTFQVIDDSVAPENEPYRRLPRLAFEFERALGDRRLIAGLDSEFVYFDRDFGATGFRTDLFPRLTFNLENAWGFLRPSLGYRYTLYDLTDDTAPVDDTLTRSLPINSVDAGLRFEKMLDGGGRQTLEPRLFYLYVPFEDQQDLPTFDTAPLTFSFSQLFHTNRFTGADRQADANQLTLALTTRNLQGRTGRERWSFAVGQIVYFDDLEVQPGDDPVVKDDLSPLIAEFNWHPLERFSSRLGLEWDWENDRLDVGMAGFEYRALGGNRLAFEYRYRRERVDQFDFRWYWPVNERWNLISRVNYSLADSDLLETQLGVEYESCCWAFRTVYRRYLKNRDGESRDGIYLELRLKGLGTVGRKAPPLFYDLAE